MMKILQDMLPFFAASGHNLYTKSAYIHLQQMRKLEIEHPNVFALNSGYHVVRRSDRYWAGLSTDLVIEQVLMRTVKTTGGLTRVRGMEELQRAQWVLSMPACSEVNYAMQEFTGSNYVTSNQHKYVSEARQIRDGKDITYLHQYTINKNPLIADQSLHNISSGDTCDSTFNSDKAEEVGCKIPKSMERNDVVGYTFKKKGQVVTMDHN